MFRHLVYLKKIILKIFKEMSNGSIPWIWEVGSGVRILEIRGVRILNRMPEDEGDILKQIKKYFKNH